MTPPSLLAKLASPKRQYRSQSDYIKQLLLDVNQEFWETSFLPNRLLGKATDLEERGLATSKFPRRVVQTPEAKTEVFAD